MGTPKEYNGHRSWNAWNVALWIGNDEPLYRLAMGCIKQAWRLNKLLRPHPAQIATRAMYLFMGSYRGEQTPDGAKYNELSVKLALIGLMEDYTP